MSDKQSHIAVLMGGWSSEREISLRSGEACAAALESQGFKVTRVDVGRDVASRLSELRPDICFNALHGRFGEDGCIQGLLEVLGIPYTHSGVLASALAMHKERAKAVLREAGVPVAESLVLSRSEAARAHAMQPPYVIKPVAEGSSVGVFIVREDQAHAPQELHSAEWTLGEEVMVERFIPGRELTCAVMGNEALGVSVGALYRELRNMEAEGLVEALRTERVGRRPARTVYAITREGGLELALLREQAIRNTQISPDSLGVALSFAEDGADLDELASWLRSRREIFALRAAELEADRNRMVAKGYLGPLRAAVMYRSQLHAETEVRWHDEFAKILGELPPEELTARQRIPAPAPDGEATPPGAGARPASRQSSLAGQESGRPEARAARAGSRRRRGDQDGSR